MRAAAIRIQARVESDVWTLVVREQRARRIAEELRANRRLGLGPIFIGPRLRGLLDDVDPLEAIRAPRLRT